MAITVPRRPSLWLSRPLIWLVGRQNKSIVQNKLLGHLQIDKQILHRLIALFGLSFQASINYTLQSTWNFRIADRRKMRRVRGGLLLHHFKEVIACKRKLTGQSLEQNTSQRIDIGNLVTATALSLLRTEVGRRAHDRIGAGQLAAAFFIGEHTRDAEIDDFNLIALSGKRRGQDNIRRLQVPVNNAILMSVCHTLRNLHSDIDDRLIREPAVSLDAVTYGRAFHQLHYQIGLGAIIEPEIVDSDQIVVTETARRPALGESAESARPRSGLGSLSLWPHCVSVWYPWLYRLRP